MTALQEMAMTLVDDNTISKAKKQFRKDEEIVALESYDMTFRLFRSAKNIINLELLLQMPAGTEKSFSSDFPGAEIQKIVTFFKPIGFYTVSKSFLSTSVEITIVHEFEKDLDYLYKNHHLSSTHKVNKLSLEENAVIAAFSMEAFLQAKNYRDHSFRVNGLDLDIYMTYDNEYPQSFLDDKYGFQGHIAAYFLRGPNQSIAPSLKVESSFKKLHELQMLSAFKRI